MGICTTRVEFEGQSVFLFRSCRESGALAFFTLAKADTLLLCQFLCIMLAMHDKLALDLLHTWFHCFCDPVGTLAVVRHFTYPISCICFVLQVDSNCCRKLVEHPHGFCYFLGKFQ